MIKKIAILVVTLTSNSLVVTQAAEWDDLPVPADAGVGMKWELQPMSDDFSYTAPANDKGEEFSSRWREGFINTWQGPGLTVWESKHSSVDGDNLIIRASRIPNNAPTKPGGVYLGSITSNKTVIYPVYMEARAQLANNVMASTFWFLSEDSTEEIDVIEAYGGDGVDNDGDEVIGGAPDADSSWFARRLHLSHHTFIREPFQDYQPKDSEGVFGTWYAEAGRDNWREDFIRVGVYWKDPWHLEYYVNGEWVRTITANAYSYKDLNGNIIERTTTFNAIDKFNYTNGTGLSKPMFAIISMEDQDWRSNSIPPLTPTDAELSDDSKNTYKVDWVRFYKPVTSGETPDTPTDTEPDEPPETENPSTAAPEPVAEPSKGGSGGGPISLNQLFLLGLFGVLTMWRRAKCIRHRFF